MPDIKDDVVNLITSFFGGETGKLVEKLYDKDHPEELVLVAENMMSKLVGPVNAKKHLQPIYSKYSNVIKRRGAA